MRVKIFILQFHAVSVTYNNANVFSNVLNTNINKLYLHEFKLQAVQRLRSLRDQTKSETTRLNNITQSPQPRRSYRWVVSDYKITINQLSIHLTTIE